MVYTTYKNGDDWGMVFDIVLTCFNHIAHIFTHHFPFTLRGSCLRTRRRRPCTSSNSPPMHWPTLSWLADGDAEMVGQLEDMEVSMGVPQ